MQALHRIELRWADGARFSLEAQQAKPVTDAAETLVGRSPLGSIVTFGATPLPNGQIDLAYKDELGLFESLRLRENADYVVELTLAMSLHEARSMWSANEPGTFWPFDSARVKKSINLMSSRYWREESSGSGVQTTVLGSANFGSFVGVVDLSFVGHNLRAEVAASKIGYYDDFKTMLDSVSEDFVELLFDVDSVSGYRFALGEPADVRPSTALFHLRRLLGESELPQAVEDILQSPYLRLVDEDRHVPPAVAATVLPDRMIAAIGSQSFEFGGPLQSLFAGHTPRSLVETTRRETVDTAENRYVKSVLEDLIVLFDRLEPQLVGARKPASVREVRTWRERVEELLADDMWQEVGSLTHIPFNSQVLLRRDSYRRVAQADLLLQYGLVLPWARGQEIADEVGDIRPVHELYEYTCLFALRRVLRQICGPELGQLGSFYKLDAGRLQVDLRMGKQSELTFASDIGGVDIIVHLFFNRIFRRPGEGKTYEDASYSTAFRPDFSLQVECGGRDHWLHFDAKYRLDSATWSAEVSQGDVGEVVDEGGGETEDADLVKKADLYKMHAYRDAILGTRGAYVLFPAHGSDVSMFVRHREPAQRHEQLFPSVGAFPLRPRGPAEQESALEAFLRAAIAHIAQRAEPYVEEMGFNELAAEPGT